MIRFPLGIWDLSLWLAITALLLLTACEAFSPYHGRVNTCISKKRLRNSALVTSVAFLVSVAINMIRIG